MASLKTKLAYKFSEFIDNQWTNQGCARSVYDDRIVCWNSQLGDRKISLKVLDDLIKANNFRAVYMFFWELTCQREEFRITMAGAPLPPLKNCILGIYEREYLEKTPDVHPSHARATIVPITRNNWQEWFSKLKYSLNYHIFIRVNRREGKETTKS